MAHLSVSRRVQDMLSVQEVVGILVNFTAKGAHKLTKGRPGVDHYNFANAEGGDDQDYLFYMWYVFT